MPMRTTALAWTVAAVASRVALVKLAGPAGSRWQGLAANNRILRLLVSHIVRHVRPQADT